MASLVQINTGITAGLAGAMAEGGGQIFSRINSLAGGQNPGLVVCPAATTGQCKAPTTAAEVDDALGVVVYEAMHQPSSTSVQYAQYETLPICEQGCIWVTCETAMAETDDVYVRFATKGGNTVLGTVRKDADTGGGTFTVAGAANADVYTVQVDGIPFEVTYTDGSPTDPEAATALAAAIDAHASYTASAVGAVVTVLLTADNNVPVVLTTTDPKVSVQQNAGATARHSTQFKVREAVSGAGLVKLQVRAA